MSIEELVHDAAQEGVNKAFSSSKVVEELVLDRFSNVQVGSRVAAEILGLHEKTIQFYSKNGLLKPLPRNGNAPLKFNLKDILTFKK